MSSFICPTVSQLKVNSLSDSMYFAFFAKKEKNTEHMMKRKANSAVKQK